MIIRELTHDNHAINHDEIFNRLTALKKWKLLVEN